MRLTPQTTARVVGAEVIPLLGSALALAVGDHLQRVAWLNADKVRGAERDRMVVRGERVHLGALVVAALALSGPGLWAVGRSAGYPGND